jgi:hypothetical protein
MPLILEPGKKLAIWLSSDEPTPIDERPKFFVRSLSMRQQSELSDEIDEANAKPTTQGIFDANCVLVSKHLIGWECMGSFEFGCDLQELLSYSEVRELLRKVMANSFIAIEEKKS